MLCKHSAPISRAVSHNEGCIVEHYSMLLQQPGIIVCQHNISHMTFGGWVLILIAYITLEEIHCITLILSGAAGYGASLFPFTALGLTLCLFTSKHVGEFVYIQTCGYLAKYLSPSRYNVYAGKTMTQ